MRRIILAVSLFILLCILLTGAASADHGYTHTDDIPMAVKFTVRVDFDVDGRPHIVTDYPFGKTGATEMNLVYNKGSKNEVLTLNYRYDTGETRVGGKDESEFPGENYAEMYRAIRNGDLTLGDLVYINTSHFNTETDWFLAYSLSGKNYVEYTEKTLASSFNGLRHGGVAKSVYYKDGRIDYSRMLKVADGSDLLIEYHPTGEIMFAYISKYDQETAIYNYDASTGLFSGKKITELGFEESDLTTEPLAAQSTESTKTEIRARVKGEAAAMKASVRVFGGLLSGIIIGILMYTILRRRRMEKADRSMPGKPDASAAEKAPEPPEETPPAVDPPEVKYMGK